MKYHIETEQRIAGGKATDVYRLFRDDNAAEVHIWPSHGFNCLAWKQHGRDLLYTSPEWETNPVPTRSGIPILFPFPNRISGGLLKFEGKTYDLPKNDSTKTHAIHGFAPRNPWRVVGYGTDSKSAWLHGDFQLSADLPHHTELWPGDARLSVTYRLFETYLRIEVQVQNVGKTAFPFGFGIHPYFAFAGVQDVSQVRLHAPARHVWETVNNMPTGEKKNPPDDLNWNRPRMIGMSQPDTLYTDLDPIAGPTHDNLFCWASMGVANQNGALEIWANRDYRESVIFTPPHRQAICWEPYTCATDAPSLMEREIDSGWKILPVDGAWNTAIELRWNASHEI